MENKKWDSCRRSQKGKPPRGVWRPTVSSWEKNFCKAIGSVDWEALLQAKKDMHLYTEVMHWDDSAVKEAFFDAKKRYWAQINGIPCDVPLPDPDLYIDKDINWDADHDPELLLDLTQDANSDKYHDPVIIFGDSFLADQSYCGVGWGFNEEDFKADHSPAGVEGAIQQGNKGIASCEAGNDLHYKRGSYGGFDRRYKTAYWRNKKFGSGRGNSASRELEPLNARADVTTWK